MRDIFKKDPLAVTAEEDADKQGVQVGHYAVSEHQGHKDLVIVQHFFGAGKTYQNAYGKDFTPQVDSYELRMIVLGNVPPKDFIVPACSVRLMTQDEKAVFMSDGLLPDPEQQKQAAVALFPVRPQGEVPAHVAAAKAAREALDNVKPTP